MSETDRELTYHDEDEVSGPGDVSFPDHTHHLQVRAELTEMVKRGIMDADGADEAYDDWLDGRGS